MLSNTYLVTQHCNFLHVAICEFNFLHTITGGFIELKQTALQLHHWTVNSRPLHSDESVKYRQITIDFKNFQFLNVFTSWNQSTFNLPLQAWNSFQNRNLLRANSGYVVCNEDVHVHSCVWIYGDVYIKETCLVYVTRKASFYSRLFREKRSTFLQSRFLSQLLRTLHLWHLHTGIASILI